MTAIEKIESALALEVLAYHDKNYLANDLLHNKERSEEMQRLLSEALAELKKQPTPDREYVPPGPIVWNGKCNGCNNVKNDKFVIRVQMAEEVSKEIYIAFHCLACGRVMIVKYKYPDLCAKYNTIP